MYARYTYVRGDPDKIEAAIDYVDGAAREAVEATPGNRGFAVLADLERGRLIGASYWDSEASMLDSEPRLAETRAAAAEALGGEVNYERYEVIVGIRHSIPGRGAPVRLAPLSVAPERVDEAITLMNEENVPRVKGTAGLCSFQLVLDRVAGNGLVVTAWESAEAAESFWPTAQQLRAQASERAGVQFGDPDTYTMIRTSVRLD